MEEQQERPQRWKRNDAHRSHYDQNAMDTSRVVKKCLWLCVQTNAKTQENGNFARKWNAIQMQNLLWY